MALPKAQKVQDWLTQFWNIQMGRKVDMQSDQWLLGPIGDVGGIADKFVERLSRVENLTLHKNIPDAGLMDENNVFPKALNPRIDEFYTKTINFDLDVWSQWKPVWGSMGHLVSQLFSRRIQQLNLPQSPIDTASGITSDILTLKDEAGTVRYRIWFRTLKKNNEVIYSGVYSHCTLPSGEACIKVAFPLPQGSATVIMRINIDAHGNLELLSKGEQYGDPGFYFIVADRLGQLWKLYIPSFHERIFVYEDDEGTLRADHTMSLWRWKTYELHYKILPKARLI